MNKLIIKILNKLNIIDKLNLKCKTSINNRIYTIPILGTIGIPNLRTEELWMITLLKTLVRNDGNNSKFIDVGANIGQTLLKIKSVSNEIEYIGFEPNFVCTFYLNTLVKENNLTGVKIIPVGISNTTEIGELEFFHKIKTDSSASIIKNFRPGNKIDRKAYVPILDISIVKKTINIENMSILKIDVEGAELEVLESFQEELKKYKSTIIIEILPVYNTTNKERLERQLKIMELIQTLDYTIFRIKTHEDKLINLIEIETIEIHSNINQCEYVFVHKSNLNLINSLLPT